MKKLIVLTFTIFTIISSQAFSQCDTIKVTGKILDEYKTPIPGVIIKNKISGKFAYTNKEGIYSLQACLGDIINISFIGYSPIEYKVIKNSPQEFNMMPNSNLGEVVVTSASNNFRGNWTGSSIAASLGYNLDGNSKGGADNIVGSASIAINPFLDKYLNAHWAVVGNIGNYLTSKTVDNIDKDLTKIAQDNNGLAIGIQGVWEKVAGHNDELIFRASFGTGYRLNSFQNIGLDSSTVSLSQWRNSAGVEFEGFRFKNGGVLQIGAGCNLSTFDSKAYEKIFGATRRSIFSFDTSVILPISANFGFMFQSTYSKNFKPIHQLGIIIKSSTK